MSLRLVALLLVGWLAATTPCQAGDALRDSDLKQAVVYNLLSFVEWPQARPPGADDLRLCVVDDAGGASTLAEIAGKRLSGQRSIAVIRLGRDFAELQKCHVVFVAGYDNRRLAAVAAGSANAPILIVGEGDKAIQNGATVGIVLSAGHVALDVDLAAARAAGLVISSKLLRLARRVYE